jgi:hypothetical protein
MGEILGLGISHYPGLIAKDEKMVGALKRTLRDPGLPEQWRDPQNWPAAMREEYGNDEGAAAATRHRAQMREHLGKARAALDEFKPDVMIVWGDDQYENFHEDVIPAFCILAYDQIEVKPWEKDSFFGINAWEEPKDKTFVYKGHRSAGKYLATQMLENGFDVAYAYKPLHHGLGHAFLNAALFLDYDRKGFPYPILPFQVNDYGRRVVSQKAGLPDLTKPIPEGELDPPSPMPWRCFDLGRAVARAMAQSPWRVALVASSSWSHAFLTEKNHWIYPDVEADKFLFDALRSGEYDKWRERPLTSIEESGQQETMNWQCLVGAMAELGRKPDFCEFAPSWIFNSGKCTAIFKP